MKKFSAWLKIRVSAHIGKNFFKRAAKRRFIHPLRTLQSATAVARLIGNSRA
ncbi:MAG: hypothetical protein KGQ57_04005 [Burkholderiales bacterium]|nr:hypothetical protein [Burkholderiales bacterium]